MSETTKSEHYKIKLSMSDVPIFCKRANYMVNSVIHMVQGTSIINGKSLMGVFALDLNEPISMIVYNGNDDDKILFEKWVVKE